MDANASQSPTSRNALLLISPFFLWGTAMVAMKGVMPLTSPFFLAGVRLLPAGILVLLAALWMGRPQPSSWRGWLWIGAFALVDGALFQGFLAQGLVRTGAGLGSVMIDSQPLAVALMARFLFNEQVGMLGWVGLALGLFGIALLGIPNEWLTALMAGQTDWLGDSTLLEALMNRGEWLMLLAALSMAVGTVMIRYVCRHVDPVVATGWHMVIGGLPMFVLSGLGETQQWQALGWSNWMAIAYSTVLGSAVAYGVFFYLAAQGNLTSLSALTFLTPVFALLFGNLFLGEVLSPLQWVGVGFTLMSIYFINQREVLLANLRQISASWGSKSAPSDSAS
ncbi:EamA family transporter [Pseudanabaena sp. FACHB-2040]|uniref:DMT family transporter n=1 Tax=Pseudanabaena sp. FACHB-2040 TaxID=2692859 RepID=UPI00168799FA|nr:EamA family transporter [Pseudanabaena sp. FACHB-2040]MBD0268292.1 EamA family transporter [Cyanobacteria bacterium Co-bin8]MBD2258129.1 EamA family transporter [Pseudanabaena sp. FACHB-2040]